MRRGSPRASPRAGQRSRPRRRWRCLRPRGSSPRRQRWPGSRCSGQGGIDEQRSCDRVRAVGDRVGARRDAAVATVDGDDADAIDVLLGVGEADEAERGREAGDALDDDVVVGRGDVDVTGRAQRRRPSSDWRRFTIGDDVAKRELDEAVVGAGLVTGCRDGQRCVGQVGRRAQLVGQGLGVVPVGDLAASGAVVSDSGPISAYRSANVRHSTADWPRP